MKVSDFDFDLPRSCIADRPVSPRDAARLLEVRADGLRDRIFHDLPQLLRPGDVLVFNDTKVIPARLLGRRGAAKVEATLHKAVADGTWRAFVRPARRVRVGDRLDFPGGLMAEVREKGPGGEITLAFDRGNEALLAALEAHGAMPLPPYIPRPEGPDARDRDDYQTVYAREPGAVAAPTAGLHFTDALLAAVDAAGARRCRATLRVGAGSFLPVTVEDTADHVMHGEHATLSAAAADAVNAARRVVAVGTTSLRLLEAAAGESGRVRPFSGETDLFITPGYRFRVVDALITNFHLPRSTLFMLVAAFSGLARMRAAYAHARDAGYRFYSYGDACFLHRRDRS